MEQENIKKDSKEIMDNVKKETEEIIECILEEGIRKENIDFLYKVVDIHKDIANEVYWENKEEVLDMRYNTGSYGNYDREEYNGYGRGRRRDSRGRYMESGRYNEGRGRRYRGHDMMDEMYEHYGNYSESRESANRGNYGAKEDTMKSLEYMLESMVDFVEMLKDDASSQEEMELIRHYTKKISEM